MDWKSAEEKIVQDDQNKWDQKVSGHELKITSDGALALSDGNGAGKAYALPDLAIG